MNIWILTVRRAELDCCDPIRLSNKFQTLRWRHQLDRTHNKPATTNNLRKHKFSSNNSKIELFFSLTCWSVSWPWWCTILSLSILAKMSIGAKIALPLMSFIIFVGGSFGSIFRLVVVEVCVIHVDMLLKTGEDVFFDSFLKMWKMSIKSCFFKKIRIFLNLVLIEFERM